MNIYLCQTKCDLKKQCILEQHNPNNYPKYCPYTNQKIIWESIPLSEYWKSNPWKGLVRHYETDEQGNLLKEHRDGSYEVIKKTRKLKYK